MVYVIVMMVYDNVFNFNCICGGFKKCDEM